MKSDQAFLIVNIGDAYKPGMGWDVGDDYTLIPGQYRPTVVHHSREVAEREALRLQQISPAGRFVVFEATHVTASIAAPRYGLSTLDGTLSGATDQRFAQLCKLGVDDDLPF